MSTIQLRDIEKGKIHYASSLYTRELKVILLYQPSQNRTILSLRTTFLAPLSKGELLLLSKAQPTIEGLFSVAPNTVLLTTIVKGQ